MFQLSTVRELLVQSSFASGQIPGSARHIRHDPDVCVSSAEWVLQNLYFSINKSGARVMVLLQFYLLRTKTKKR